MRRSQKSHPRVRRITVDERLDPGLLKIALAELLPGHDDLSEDPLDAWSEETVRLIGSDDLLPMLELGAGDPALTALAGNPSGDVGPDELVGMIWRSLEEGQVFLAGEIEVEAGGASASPSIVARPGSWAVLRIDRIEAIKSKHEALYSRALTGER